MNVKSHNTLKFVLFLGFIQIIYLATIKGEKGKRKRKRKEKEKGRKKEAEKKG